MDELKDSIRQWSRRAQLQRSVGLAFFGLACGLGAALVLALASRVFPILDTGPLVAIAIGLALLGLLIALAYPWLRGLRRGSIDWARAFDSTFGLQDRLSTALELGEGAITTKNDGLRNSQRRDANTAAEAIDAKARLPLRFSRRDAAVSLLFFIALVVALALPNPQQQVLAQREQLRQTIAQQVQQLDQAREAIENSALSDEQKQQALQALDQARRALEDPNVTPEEAMAAINEAQAQLDALNDAAAQQRAQDLQQAGEGLSADELTNSLASALANNDFDRAAEEMRNLAGGGEGRQPLGEEEQQRAANQLDQLARGVQDSDPDLAQQLRDAAQQLREGNAADAQQSLDQAAQSLDQAEQSSASSQSLDNAQARAEAARQAIAQAAQQDRGQPAGQQAAQQSGQQGDQQNSAQPGDGNQAGQAAPGEGQAGAGEQPGQQAGMSSLQGGPGDPTGQSQRSDDVGTDDRVYAPRRVGGDGRQVVLPGTQGENAPNPSGRASTAPGGNSTVPYQDVYGEYSQVADEALQTGEVPPDMRDYVRDYFSSLDPNQSRP